MTAVHCDDENAVRRRAALATWPEADLSDENLARLIAGLPTALVSAMSEAAEEARALAFHAHRMIRRFRNMQAAVDVLVGASAFRDGGSLLVAIEDRTDLKVVWEVLHGIGTAVDDEDDESLRSRAWEHCERYGEAPTRLA